MALRMMPEDIRHLAEAGDIPAGKALLKAVEVRRDELRAIVESDPTRDDVSFNLAQVYALNWVLAQPQQAENKQKAEE